MLQYCAAVICTASAQNDAWTSNLADQAGFGRISSYDREWPQAPVAFFLVHAGLDEQDKARLISAVRGNGMFRFSPILLVGEEGRPLVRTLAEYQQAGFDDALMVDGNLPLLTARIEAQLRDEQVYYSTLSYFGPDRRRWERQATRTTPQTPPYDRYRIRRDPLTGIRVIEHLSFGQTNLAETSAARAANSGRH